MYIVDNKNYTTNFIINCSLLSKNFLILTIILQRISNLIMKPQLEANLARKITKNLINLMMRVNEYLF